jgi:hypothetical protein
MGRGGSSTVERLGDDEITAIVASTVLSDLSEEKPPCRLRCPGTCRRVGGCPLCQVIAECSFVSANGRAFGRRDIVEVDMALPAYVAAERGGFRPSPTPSTPTTNQTGPSSPSATTPGGRVRWPTMRAARTPLTQHPGTAREVRDPEAVLGTGCKVIPALVATRQRRDLASSQRLGARTNRAHLSPPTSRAEIL